jgi:hypothetical protein
VSKRVFLVVVLFLASFNPPSKAKMVSQSSVIVVWAKFAKCRLIRASEKPFLSINARSLLANHH